MLACMFRFVCQNGFVCGDTVTDVRVPHKGDVAAQVSSGCCWYGCAWCRPIRCAARADLRRGGRCRYSDPAHAGSIHGEGSGGQAGRGPSKSSSAFRCACRSLADGGVRGGAILPVDGPQKIIAGEGAESEFAALEGASQASGHAGAGKVEDVGTSIEEDVGGSTLPLLDELLIRSHPAHDGEFLAVKIDGARAEVKRHAEIGS